MAVAADALVQYLSSLPPVNLDRLYADSWVCHALLRALPPLARLYVVRLAAAHGSLPKALVDSWPARVREAAKRHEESMQQLHLLRLVHRVPAAGSGQEQLRLHEAFGAAMLDSLGQGPPGLADDASARHGKDKNMVGADELERMGAAKWERLMSRVISPPDRPIPLAIASQIEAAEAAEGSAAGAAGASLQELLEAAGLIEARNGAEDEGGAGGGDGLGSADGLAPAQQQRRWRTSREGKRYLLESLLSQVWKVLLAYVSLCRRVSPAAHDAALSLALRLPLLPAATDYPSDDLSELQRRALTDFAELLGIAFQRKPNSRRFYATPHAASLLAAFDSAAAAAASASPSPGPAGASAARGLEGGWLIIETNFRLYAHSSSELRARVLRSFALLSYQLPGLIVGSLTRTSIQHAVDSGVDAAAIVAYLERNAHPLMAAQTPVLPETVVNQIHLWAKERSRMAADRCKLYDAFDSLRRFDEACTYAREIGAHLWSRRFPEERNLHKCSLAVRAEAHGSMKSFLRAAA